LNGGVLCGHPEGIPPDRMDDIQSPHKFMAGNDIHDGKISNVPHMDAARGIGVHFQAITFRFLWVFLGFEDLLLRPDFLPLCFDPLEIVVVFHFSATILILLSFEY
jgi:hypothetical protein